MASVTLSIQARLYGPVSLGTVDVIKAVQAHAGLGVGDAKALVDRCVFDGETVTIPGLSDTSASALWAHRSRALPSPIEDDQHSPRHRCAKCCHRAWSPSFAREQHRSRADTGTALVPRP